VSPTRLTRRGRAVLLVAGLALAAAAGVLVSSRLAGEVAGTPRPATPSSPSSASFVAPEPDLWEPAVAAALPEDPRATLVDDPSGPAGSTAILASVVQEAPIVVAVALTDAAATDRAAQLARVLSAPLLLGPPPVRSVAPVGGAPTTTDLAGLFDAWSTRLVVAVGEVSLPPGVDVRRWSGDGATPAAVTALQEQAAARPVEVDPGAPMVLVRAGDGPMPDVLATVRAVGIGVAIVDDPFVLGDAQRASIASATDLHLLGATDAWADVDPSTLSWHLQVVRSGVQLPGGGYRMFPDRRFVALYGHPEGPALGLLGEQGIEDAIVRAREHAEQYTELSTATIVPAFEIIATIASAGPTSRGDYSRRTPIQTLRPWVEAAGEAGLYVVLDLQPGRADFLSQAQEYEELLRLPYVGLALDPEWRLRSDEVHLRQIGSVGIDEVNEVASWLADLTRDQALPQKLFVLHQFRLSMIRDREQLDTTRPELAYLIHVDGQGGQEAKDATYRALTTLDPPAGVWWGWKNFYDEDIPGLRSPADTLAVTPSPVFVTYQ